MLPEPAPEGIIPAVISPDEQILRALRSPKDTEPEPEPLSIAAANTASFWANRTYFYYNQIPAGNVYVWSAQLGINAGLGITFFQFISHTYGGTACERSMRNDLFGKLIVHAPPPFLWFEMPVRGEQIFMDACDPPLDYTKPIAGTDAYGVNLLDPNGTRIQIYNGNYRGTGFDNFVMHRIR